MSCLVVAAGCRQNPVNKKTTKGAWQTTAAAKHVAFITPVIDKHSFQALGTSPAERRKVALGFGHCSKSRRKAMKSILRIMLVLVLVASAAMILTCVPTAQSKDPAAVTKAVLENINKGRADAAASMFAEDAEFISTLGQPVGVKKIRIFFALSLIALKTRIETHEITANGPNVTGTFTIQSAHFIPVPTLMEVIAVVVDGKVKSMTWTTPKK
jgi:hypothetical protein